MSELGELSGKAKRILEEYENSKEYKRFQELTKAISKDEEINRLCTILNELQAICRTKESDLLEKRLAIYMNLMEKSIELIVEWVL